MVAALFWSLLISSNLTALEPRRLIIACEAGDAEYYSSSLHDDTKLFQCRPSGLGAVSDVVMTALYQAAAPVVTTQAVCESIFAHARLFDDFLQLPLDQLAKSYGRYPRFQSRTALAAFKESCMYIHKLYRHTEKQMPKFAKSTPDEVKKMLLADTQYDQSRAPESFRQGDNLFINEIRSYLLAWVVAQQDLLIKKIPGSSADLNLYVLVCKAQLEKLKKQSGRTSLNALTGLSLDHQQEVESSTFTLASSAKPASIPDFQKNFLQGLLSLFGPESKHYSWSFYMIGHGMYSQDCHDDIVDLIAQGRVILNGYRALEQQKHLCKVQEKQLAEQITIFESAQGLLYGYLDQELLATTQKNYQDICDQLATITEKLVASRAQIESLKQSIYEVQSVDRIAGLAPHYFAQLLSYLAHNQRVSFFFYTSCFTGGSHCAYAFIDPQTLGALCLPFTVATDNLTEAPTKVEPAALRLGFTHQGTDQLPVETELMFDLEHSKLQCSDRNFSTYFELIEQGAPLEAIARGLMPQLKTKSLELSNMLNVRRAGCDYFTIIDHDQWAYVLSAATIAAATQVEINKPLILVYEKEIPQTLMIPTSEFPAVVSMIPGKAYHHIACLKAEKCTFADIISGCIPLAASGSAKAWSFDRIICRNGDAVPGVEANAVITLQDVECMVHAPLDGAARKDTVFFSHNNTRYQMDMHRAADVECGASKKSLTYEEATFFNYFSFGLHEPLQKQLVLSLNDLKI